MEKLKEILADIEKAIKICESSASWRIKYQQISGLRLTSRINNAGFKFEPYSPDLGYDDDTKAYVSALKEFQEEVGNLAELFSGDS